MKKSTRCIAPILSAVTLLASLAAAPAANIVWVSDNGAEGTSTAGTWYPPVSTGAPYVDQAFVDLLINAGHTVTRYNCPGALPAGDHAQLNTYDLIIVGSAQNSGAFNATSSAWNTAITRPMIITKSTLIRGTNRLGWLTGNTEVDSAADASTTANGKLTLHQQNHPIFAGISHDDVDMTNFCGIRIPVPLNNRGTSIQLQSLIKDGIDQAVVNTPAGGGVVLATVYFNPLDPGVTIPTGQFPSVYGNYLATGYTLAEWATGSIMANGGQSLAGPRLLFACGTRDASGSATGAPNPQAGAMDLSADGQQMFLKAVRYMAAKVAPAGANTWTNGSADSMWNLTSANWSAASTTWTSGADAAFGAAGAGPVTLGEPITARNFWVGAAGYSFAGSPLTFAGTTPTLTANAPVTISANIQGTDGLTLQGGSSLTLEGTNTYTGGTRLRCGTLIMRAPTTANNPSPYAVDSIEALDAGATLHYWQGAPVISTSGVTNGYLVNNRAGNGQIYRYSNITMTGGTFDLNGGENVPQYPGPTGYGIITNNSPLDRGILRLGVASGQTKTFSGIIQNGNGGVVVESIVPNIGTTVPNPLVYKPAYRVDVDLQAMADGSATYVLDNANTYTGFTRIGGGKLSFTSRGKWGAVVTTGNATTSTPNGSIICNGPNNVASELRVDFNGTSQVTGGLSGNGGIFANNLSGTCSVLTVGAGNISNTAWPTGGSGQNGRITDNTTGTGGMVALTKIGTGTIGLPTAQNNYSGPTLIANGTLEFTATGAPSPNSDHQINSPAKLKLSYAGSRNVNSLYINGFKQPAGTYSAADLPSYIEGSGSVTIVEVHPPSVAEISITRTSTSVTVLWTGGCGVLQESTNLTTWTDLPGATSPYVTPTTAQRKYFRIRQ